MHKVGFIWSGYVGKFRFVYSCKTGCQNDFKYFFVLCGSEFGFSL